jgi:molybdenum cofactor synthesis domain-containing protein
MMWKWFESMFRKLLSLEEARDAIAHRVRPRVLGTEEVTLLGAFDRILAEDIVAAHDIPPFNRATVDGYAVRAQDTFGAGENRPVRLKVCGTVRTGHLSKIKVGKKQAAEIFTGAPIPEGADAVVMVEHTEKESEHIRVFTAIPKSGNIMEAGSDIRKGETVLAKGRRLGSKEIGAVAALGIDQLKAQKIPVVAVFSTGPEVIQPGGRLAPGKIHDINSYSLSAAVLESGGKPVHLGIVEDDFSKLEETLKVALKTADMVVTSGGVSVGPKDLLPKVLAFLGRSGLIVTGIAIKPGKPTTVADIDGKLVYSLPGHPASALMIFHLLVRPTIQAMAGMAPTKDPEVEAVAAARMFSAKGRKTFVMVKLKEDKSNGIFVEPVSKGDSGAITTLTKADGFVEIPENVQFVDAKERITVHLFGKSL